ncbi:MAG: hypothetical protein PHX34_05275 [Candidatus Shapirobacteria bacterium]|nr:hypothetical protein [Candidatus Shapirobacteria bacterium]
MCNALSHALAGIGVGILITYPFVGSHPLRWGAFFLVVGLIGHLYAYFAKK